MPNPDRPVSEPGLPDPDRPTDSNGPSVDEVWERIKQSVHDMHEQYLDNHAVAEKTGANPILESRNKVQDNLDKTTKHVEKHRDKLASDDLNTFERIVQEIKDFCTMTGDTAWLEKTAETWMKDIAGPLSGHEGWFTLDFMATDNSWSGPAAKVYKDQFGPQKSAMAGVKTIALELRDALIAISSQVKKFWANLVLALAKAAADLAAEVIGWIGVDTIVNPGEKVGGIINVLADAIDRIIQNFFEASRAFNRTADRIRKSVIKQGAFRSDSGGGGRGWPRPAVPLSTDRDDWVPGPVG